MSRFSKFKVGIVRCHPEKGWSHEYRIMLLESDSMLGDLPDDIKDDPNVTEEMALREDQPEYDRVTDFHSLRRVFDEREEEILELLW